MRRPARYNGDCRGARMVIRLLPVARERTTVQSILFERVLRGQPTLLANNGGFIDTNLRREQIDADDVLMAMREHDIGDVRQVKMAVLETDGSTSIVPVAGTSAVRTRRYSRFLRRRD